MQTAANDEGVYTMSGNLNIILCGMAALLVAGADIAAAASFDCYKARSRQEKLICDNRQLSDADKALAEVYGCVLKNSSDREGLKKEQQDWIKAERNACENVECLLNAYKSRIMALENHIQKSLQEALREADERFTFRQEPISPRMLNDLLPLFSDTLPGPVAVDLEGGGNRYYSEVTVPEKGIVRATWKGKYGGQMFQYQHLGRLTNGMHVIKTWENTGGSGTFMDLLLVKFLIDTEYKDGGILRYRLLMMRTGSFSLGAGYNGDIKVSPDKISIGPGGSGIREKARTETISFQ